jgi:anaerobic magnesium-protoporphyrin IX monomethyl ester cyclase
MTESVTGACGLNTCVIVPPVVCHGLDPHTGIPFMPHMAAYLAGALRDRGLRVHVLDSFGIDSHSTQVVRSEFLLMGLGTDKVVDLVREDCSVCFIYCRTIAEFVAVEQLVDGLVAKRRSLKIVLFENIQSVTSYSLVGVAEKFIRRGVDCIIGGEPEDRCVEIAERLAAGRSLEGIPGIVYTDSQGVIIREKEATLAEDLDSLPMPAWEVWDLEGYWNIGFAHAPVKKGDRFLPLLTSRGCPFRCTFCISPGLNPKWRARSALHVVEEIEHFHKTLGINDFHISDLNPTVSDERIREFSREVLRRGIKVSWKLAQGTKIETIKDRETIELMAKSGCTFVSFSPETGSKRLLRIMNKPFDHEHALKMVGYMRELGIRMQACFLAGVPGEDEEDRLRSIDYATRLIKSGVDEISTVIFTPLPGARLSGALKGYVHYSQCTPSPSWRADYRVLKAYRRRMYLNLFTLKLFCFPRKFFREMHGFLTRNFETKMEMSLYKQIKLYVLRYFPCVYRRK